MIDCLRQSDNENKYAEWTKRLDSLMILILDACYVLPEQNTPDCINAVACSGE
jgi:hypothetical protein